MEAIAFDVVGDDTVRSVVFAKDQPEYAPLPAVVYPDGTVLTEWRLTDEERTRIARGENLRLWIWTGHRPLQPVQLEVTSEERP